MLSRPLPDLAQEGQDQGTRSVWAHVSVPGSLLQPVHSLIQHHSLHRNHMPPMGPM